MYIIEDKIINKKIITLLLAVTFNSFAAEDVEQIGNDGSYLLDDPSLDKFEYTGQGFDLYNGVFTLKNKSVDDNLDNSLLIIDVGVNNQNDFPSGFYTSWCIDGYSCEVNNANTIVNNSTFPNSGQAAISSAVSSIMYTDLLKTEPFSVIANGNTFVNNSSNLYSAIGAVSFANLRLNSRNGQGDVNYFSNVNGSVFINNSNSDKMQVYGASSSVYITPYHGGVNSETHSIGNVYVDNSIVGSVGGISDGFVFNDYAIDYDTMTKLNGKHENVANVFVRDSTINDYIRVVDNSYQILAPPVEEGHFSITSTATLTLEGNITTTYNTEISGFSLYIGDKNNTFDNLNAFKNNTFNFKSNAISIGNLSNFANYNFYINDDNYQNVIDHDYLITVNGTFTNIDDITDGVHSSNTSNVKIQGISGKYAPEKGDTINLIDLSDAKLVSGETESTIDDLFNSQDDNTVQVGLSKEAIISYKVDNENNQIYAVIDEIKQAEKEKITTNIKPLAEGHLASLMNATRGNDELISMLGKNEEVGTFTPMAKIAGGINKYGNSNNNVDSNDYRLIIGSRYQFTDNFYAGIAAEYGISNYDTHNEFTSDNVNGSGNAKNYAATLFAKYSYNDFYAKAAVSLGRTTNDYRSNDIITGSGTNAKYTSDANYVSSLASVGYIYELNEKYSFDTSLTYFYTKLNSDSVVIDGDKVKFKNSTSSRMNIREAFNYKATENSTMYMAVAYENEFDSKAKASINGINVSAPDAKGSTGIFELGLKGNPFTEIKALEFNVNAKGYSGKRKGITGSIYAQYNF